MNAKTTLITFFATPVVLYLLLFAVYVLNPFVIHFRAWELYDIFVYSGFYGRHHHVTESGDSSRDFLLQRYSAAHQVSVNEFGNRTACYDPSSAAQPSILVLGDSQLFGSGTGDGGTFTSHLCQLYNANVYNGSRRHGLSLLRVDSFRFDSILFTATERGALSKAYCERLEQFAAEYDRRIAAREIQLARPSFAELVTMLRQANRFLRGYLIGRLNALFGSVLRGPLAPAGHIIAYSHRIPQPASTAIENEVSCAKMLAAYFEPKGITVGFLYFPAHQTIYGREAGFAVDDDTANFIDAMSEKFADEKLRTMNAKSCLNTAKSQMLVFQMHDSHLNADGYASLARCLRQSTLWSLFAPVSADRR